MYLLLLLSCTTDVEPTSNKTTSFLVGKVEVVNSDRFSQHPQGHWPEIINSRHVTLKTCLEDISIEGYPVREDVFKISTYFGKQKRTTDFRGCLTWTEVIDFNYLAEEKYLEFPIEVKGIGNYSGQVSLTLALNPWRESASEQVRDIRYVDRIRFSAPITNESLNNGEAVTKSISNFDVSNRNFLLRDFGLELKEIKSIDGSQNVHFSMKTRPHARRKLLSGERQVFPLSRGIINFKMTLYENIAGSNQIIPVAHKTQEIDFENFEAIGNIHFKVNDHHTIDTSSTLIISLEATPKSSMTPITSEVGLLYLHNINSTSRVGIERFSSVDDELHDRYEIIHSINRNNDQKLDLDELTQRWSEVFSTDFSRRSLRVSSVNISKGYHLSDNYNSSATRTIISDIEVCFVEQTNNTISLQDTYFEVSVNNNKNNPREEIFITEIETDSRGCIQFSLPVKYNLFSHEKWIPHNINMKALNGRHQGEIINRLIAINPWSERGFSRDLHRQNLPQSYAGNHENATESPEIYIGRVAYSNEGNNLDKLIINKFLNLGLNKTYHFTVWPKVKKLTGFDTNTPLKPITFGNYKLVIDLLSPNREQVSYTNIDLNDWDILSSSKEQVTVRPDGKISTDVNFPIMAHDSYRLTFKNLILVRLVPLDEDTSHLQEQVFAAPFFGLYEGADLFTVKLPKEDYNFTQENKQELKQLRALGVEHIMKGLEDNLPSPKELFRQEFKKEAKSVSPSAMVFTGNLEELNRRLPLNENIATDWSEIPESYKEDHYTELSMHQLHSMARTSTRTPQQVLRIFCRHLYEVPVQRGLFANLRLTNEQKEEIEEYEKCLETPDEYLQAMPLQHIHRIIPFRERNPDGSIRSERLARLASTPERGGVFKGSGAFATTGERYGHTFGERDATGYHGGIDLAPSIPFFGARAGYGYEFFKYEGHEQGRMDWMADRTSTLRNIEFTYESIELNFRAEVHACSTVRRKSNLNRVHVCENDTSIKSINEKWYFIGQANQRQNGVLADANPSLEEHTSMVIRGAANYKATWGQFKDESHLLIISQLKTLPMAEGMIEIRARGTREWLFESYIDNSFPGLIIPDENDTTVRNYHR